MNTNSPLSEAIESLVARLKLEEGLGSTYISGNSILADLSEIARTTKQQTTARPGPPPAETIQNRAPTTLQGMRRTIESLRSHETTPPPAAQPRQQRQPDEPDQQNTSSPEPPKVRFTLVPYLTPAPCPKQEAELEPLRQEARTCQLCDLCSKRTHMVWGEGALNAKVMFIGEGPGKDEDEQARPFVGRSGRLLTDIIEKGMKVQRREVYIANVVKCRPPGNRDPKPDEVAACSVYLNKQIEVVKPQVIVAVGMVAGRALLGLEPGTGGLRKRWYEYNGIPLRVIYHPSYLLRARKGPDDRTPADKETWLDIQEVMGKVIS
jgi:uracil-DNA glycosylase, family 4